MPSAAAALLLLPSVLGFAPDVAVAACGRVIAATRAPCVSAQAPTVRDQMKAYLKSVQERGVELTPEQKAMIAEMEADEEMLDATGLPDFLTGAKVMSKEDFEAEGPAQQPEEPEMGASYGSAAQYEAEGRPELSAAAGSLTVRTPQAAPVPRPLPELVVNSAAARMWQVQRAERDVAVQLLGKRLVDAAPLPDMDAQELRRVLSSLIATLTMA